LPSPFFLHSALHTGARQMSVDVNTLSSKELRAVIVSAGFSHDDCASKDQLVQRASEALAGGGATQDAVKGQTNSMLESELKEKKLELADVMEEEAEILDLQREGREIRPGRILELTEERTAVEEAIGKLEDALHLQTRLDDLRAKLRSEQAQREELEEVSLDTTDLILVESQKRQSILLENNIAKIEETIAAQVQVDDLESDLRAKLQAMTIAIRDEARNENSALNGYFRRKTEEAERELKESRDALTNAQEATVRETFVHWDNDGSGSITRTELSQIFKQLGLSEDAIDKLFVSIDKNKDGQIDLQEFMNWTFNKQ